MYEAREQLSKIKKNIHFFNEKFRKKYQKVNKYIQDLTNLKLSKIKKPESDFHKKLLTISKVAHHIAS